MANKRINITLPPETIKELDELIPFGERSSFIDKAIQAYISQIQREKLRQQLKESAICRAERDLCLASDWFSLEEEAWQEDIK